MNRFRNHLATLLIAVLSCISNSAFSDDFQSAELAYENEDFYTARILYTKEAKRENPKALEFLGMQYLVGLHNVFEKNEALSAEYLKKALDVYSNLASKGNAEAQVRLGKLYSNKDEGKYFGVDMNKEESAKWYKKGFETYQRLADKGDPEAQTVLADAYQTGHGIGQDADKAITLYKNAAKQKYARANEELGSWLLRYNDPESEAMGIRYLEEAMNEGSRFAKKLLTMRYSNNGNDYSSGNGVAKDSSKAFINYQKAANLGEAYSQFKVGVAYYFGDGANQDKEKAAFWFQKAASNGSMDAQYNFGIMLINGEGIARNVLRGYVCIIIAAGRGKNEAIQTRDNTERMLSLEDQREGQKKASEWKKGVSL